MLFPDAEDVNDRVDEKIKGVKKGVKKYEATSDSEEASQGKSRSANIMYVN